MKSRSAISIAIAAAITLVACGSDDSGSSDDGTASSDAPTESSAESDTGEEPTGDGETVVGFASAVLSNPNQADFGRAIEGASTSVGAGYISADANLSLDKQISDVDTLVSQEVDGLITWALDPAGLGPSLERAQEAGVLVVGLSTEGPFVNTNIAQERFTCAEENSHGEQVAEYIAGFKPGANVLVIGPPPVPILESMTVCFSEAATAAGLNVIDRGDNVNDTAATATPIVADLLTKHSDIDAIWAYNDSTAIGASAALRGAGLDIYSGDTDGVVVTGGNGGLEAVEAVEAGVITATFDSNSPEAGQAAVKVLNDVLSGAVDVADLPAEIVIPVTMVDFTNFGDYIPYGDRDVSL